MTKTDWHRALIAPTKRLQYKWHKLVEHVDSQLGLSKRERQKMIDEGYRKIFMGGR
jgi:hypothetical protein